MSNDKSDWLSALADGELEGRELERGLDALRDDPALQSSWKAYHVIRDTVSSNLNRGVEPLLHQRVSAALDSEPTILAPQVRQRAWLKQVAGVAIAASVAGVAVVGVQRINNVDSAPAAVPVAKQEYMRIEPTLVAEGKNNAVRRNQALDRYLVNHNEFSANSGIQGVLPYVRIVGHKVGQ